MPRAVPVTIKDRDAGFTASLSDPAMTAVWATRAASEPSATMIAARRNVGRDHSRFGATAALKL